MQWEEQSLSKLSPRHTVLKPVSPTTSFAVPWDNKLCLSSNQNNRDVSWIWGYLFLFFTTVFTSLYVIKTESQTENTEDFCKGKKNGLRYIIMRWSSTPAISGCCQLQGRERWGGGMYSTGILVLERRCLVRLFNKLKSRNF